MQKSWILLPVLLAIACTEQTPVEESALQTGAPETPNMPAGFLDQPPAPPTSNTMVLSGGNLVLDDVSVDTAVVIRDGKLIAWGKRGEVDMPNDSMGKDMRGKWLTPGSIADLEAGNLPNLAELKPEALANILIFKVGPDLSEVTGDDLYAVVADGEIQIFDAESD